MECCPVPAPGPYPRSHTDKGGFWPRPHLIVRRAKCHTVCKSSRTVSTKRRNSKLLFPRPEDTNRKKATICATLELCDNQTPYCAPAVKGHNGVETVKQELFPPKEEPYPRPRGLPTSPGPSLTICLPRATAACTFLREPSFSSNTSADQMAQLTCVHSFCPMYRSRPASWGQRSDMKTGPRDQALQPGASHSSPHLRICIAIFETKSTLTRVFHM